MDWVDPLPGEGHEAFEAFSAYRDLEHGRSLLDLAQWCTLGNLTQLRAWSREFFWERRCAAYDEYCAERRRVMLTAARAARVEIASERLVTGHRMVIAGRRGVERLINKADDLSARDVTRLIEAGLKLIEAETAAGMRSKEQRLGDVLAEICTPSQLDQIAERLDDENDT